jgi:Zn-dependent protease
MDDTPIPPEPVAANLPPVAPASHEHTPNALQPRRRRWRLPLALFVITCLSTFWAGVAGKHALYLVYPQAYQTRQSYPDVIANMVQAKWTEGLTYMSAVIAILAAHEMGHFLLTLRHRIPASWPFFIPMPISFVGTMGAVIAMQAYRANRRQLFDIGIAGPLAGLVVAIPITIVGIQQARVVDLPPQIALQADHFDDPLLVELLIRWLRPDATQGELYLNPLLMAGWVGFLITGLNMMPISQLDGGHISYALLGRRAHVLARVVVLAAVIFMLWAEVYQWAVMLILVALIGLDHPPTADDDVPLGLGRTILGWSSFAIPILCFPVMGVSLH